MLFQINFMSLQSLNVVCVLGCPDFAGLSFRVIGKQKQRAKHVLPFAFAKSKTRLALELHV